MPVMQLPKFIEVEEMQFKDIDKCTYADVLAARNREADFRRRAMLNKLIRLCRPTWSLNPSLAFMDIEEMWKGKKS